MTYITTINKAGILIAFLPLLLGSGCSRHSGGTEGYQTDMANAKKIVGDTCCIAGNVPASVVITGTAKEVKEPCRKLIEICAPGGGYILGGGASATGAKAENVRAFMEAAEEYGVYSWAGGNKGNQGLSFGFCAERLQPLGRIVTV